MAKVKRFYKIKPKMKANIRKKIRFNKLAQAVGVSDSYMSEIVNGKAPNISKTLAYCIVKAISPNLEIGDIFDITEKLVE